LEQEYRILYWERNELQIILPDSPNQPLVLSMIRKLNEREQQIVSILGYTPQP
jgi:hypothetical protein